MQDPADQLTASMTHRLEAISWRLTKYVGKLDATQFIVTGDN